MVFQKRNWLSGNELFEMMRSREVYYVQNELRKDLDRTIRALEQAEKTKLAGLRIQKAIFLKRKSILDMRKRRLKNSFVATKNTTVISNHIHSNIHGPSVEADTKQGHHDSSRIIKAYSVANPGKTIGRDQVPTMHTDNKLTGSVGRHPRSDQPVQHVGETAMNGSHVNSECMCSIQEEQKKSNLQAERGTDNSVLPHNQSDDKPYIWKTQNQQSEDQDIQTIKGSTFGKNSSRNNSQRGSKLAMRPRTLLNTGGENNKNERYKGENNINERYKGEKQNDDNIRACSRQVLHFSINNVKLGLDSPTAVHKYPENGGVTDDHIKRNEQLGKSSVVDGMQALSMNEDSNKQQAQPELHRSNQQVVEITSDRRYGDWRQKIKQSSEHVPQKDFGFLPAKPSLDKKKFVLGAVNLHRSLDVSSKAKQMQKNFTDEATLNTNPHKEAYSNHTNMSRHLTRKQMLLSPSVPYLDRPTRHLPEKLNHLLADRDSRSSRSTPGSLERTVTMIFVEDPTLSRQDPPKSQFDFEAWLAYNKRKRGHTEIFDDKSSIVTSDDVSIRTSTTQETKRSSKNRVRFDFPKRLNMSTPTKPNVLTFREKSKEWYLNFLKKSKGHFEANKHMQKNLDVGKYVSATLSYALLPNISTGPDHRMGNYSSSELDSANRVLSREGTDEKLQRLKDYSRHLRVKVHDFVYS
ncbi:hypothetical protein BsWGS_02516 [Bradybaena similaris]